MMGEKNLRKFFNRLKIQKEKETFALLHLIHKFCCAHVLVSLLWRLFMALFLIGWTMKLLLKITMSTFFVHLFLLPQMCTEASVCNKNKIKTDTRRSIYWDVRILIHILHNLCSLISISVSFLNLLFNSYCLIFAHCTETT